MYGNFEKKFLLIEMRSSDEVITILVEDRNRTEYKKLIIPFN